MKCFLRECDTTTENLYEKTKPGAIDVSFVKFPKDPNTRKLWLKSLCIIDPLPDDAKICSLHFLDDDLYLKNGVLRVSSAAIPIIMPFCTICQDTTNKLFSLTKYKVEQVFAAIARIPVCTNIKPGICTACLVSLGDSILFKQMCQDSRMILEEFALKITPALTSVRRRVFF
ncbi:uncharacterized protein LOC112050437 [Bicyclus anynana]|uniref:Uncharacterized protein LOC112050437 n=1 Tax=Bicyclus anynana TaxID=110368 RepID=A0A6J1NC44_BICAN|nr:uncharacterized protein LOC112050437 [Bicyclus anynana]